MKETAQNSKETTATVINKQMEQVDPDFRPYFPREAALKKTLQRTKRKAFPALPRSLADVRIEGKNQC